MRVIIATLCLILVTIGGSVAASAQLWDELKRQTPEEIASGQTDFWARTLGLSVQQAADLQQLNLRHAAAMSSAAKAENTDAQKHAALEDIDTTKSAETLDILTAEQRDRYLALLQSMRRVVSDHSR